jgi:hypothetical protein
MVEENAFMFQRDAEGEIILVAFQRGSQTRPAGLIPVAHGAIPNGVEFEELFTHKRVQVQNGNFPLPEVPPGAQVWIARNI